MPAAVEEVVATVSVENEPAATEVGFSEQVALLGQPEVTDKVTVPEYPFNGETLIVEVAELPAAMVAEVGLADSKKSGLVVQLRNLKEPMRVYQL